LVSRLSAKALKYFASSDGMLFLLAGYEIELGELTGRGGRRALVTWLICFALALGLVGVVGLTGAVHAEIAVAIALVSTALGTLLPILKDNGQLDTKLGSAGSQPWRFR
jgi:Kef-type K+ transport system membrane component KefB